MPGSIQGISCVCVKEKYHFVDELVFADGAGDGRERGIGRHGRDEIARIESAQRGLSGGAGS